MGKLIWVLAFGASHIWQQVAAVPPTSGEDLGILIMGSIVEDDLSKNVALIKEIKKGKVQAVKVGFTILGNLTVKKITKKYIEVEDIKTKKASLVFQEKYASEYQKSNKKTPSKPKISNTDEFSEDGFSRRGGKISVTTAYKDKVLSNLSTVLMQATATPKKIGDKLHFTLEQIDSDSIYAKAGFINGDEITSINGVSFSNVVEAVKYLNSLKKETEVEVEFLRNNQFQTTRISID